MDEFDEFDEFGDVQENVVRREIKSDEGSNYYDPDPEILPRKRHDILIQFCSS